jgi:hypothetical protein
VPGKPRNGQARAKQPEGLKLESILLFNNRPEADPGRRVVLLQLHTRPFRTHSLLQCDHQRGQGFDRKGSTHNGYRSDGREHLRLVGDWSVQRTADNGPPPICHGWCGHWTDAKGEATSSAAEHERITTHAPETTLPDDRSA